MTGLFYHAKACDYTVNLICYQNFHRKNTPLRLPEDFQKKVCGIKTTLNISP